MNTFWATCVFLHFNRPRRLSSILRTIQFLFYRWVDIFQRSDRTYTYFRCLMGISRALHRPLRGCDGVHLNDTSHKNLNFIITFDVVRSHQMSVVDYLFFVLNKQQRMWRVINFRFYWAAMQQCLRDHHSNQGNNTKSLSLEEKQSLRVNKQKRIIICWAWRISGVRLQASIYSATANSGQRTTITVHKSNSIPSILERNVHVRTRSSPSHGVR